MYASYIVSNIAKRKVARGGYRWKLWSGCSVSVSSLKLRRREKRWGRRKFRNGNLIPIQHNAIIVICRGGREVKNVNEEKECLGSENREIRVKVKPRGTK